MQGGECANIFISATVSDPITIGKNVDFILDLNRSNVAFSRVQERLIIIVSQSLLNYIPSQLENYKETLLWKELRLICSQQIALVNLDKYEVKILVPNKDD
jgi:superfamily I DNA and/or RNA helicase